MKKNVWYVLKKKKNQICQKISTVIVGFRIKFLHKNYFKQFYLPESSIKNKDCYLNKM